MATMSRPWPPYLSYWLTADGSLTTLLEAKAQQPLIVKRTYEGYRPLTLAQKKKLGFCGHRLNRPMLAWVRESLLYGCDEQPWVRAQSVFPLVSLRGEAKRLQYLQSTPVGYVLFKRQAILPSCRTIEATSTGWQRQTIYDWRRRPLLISETFLPSLTGVSVLK